MVRWQHWMAAAALGMVASSGTALAQSSQLYGGVSAGTATYFDQGGFEFDYLGFVLAGQLGMRLTPDLRVEGELSYQSTSAEDDIGIIDVDVDLTVIRPSVSAYYDLNTVSLGGLTPFVGGGLGLAFIEADFDSGFGSDDDTELSANLDAGANMSLGGNLDLVPMARWELTDDASNIQLRVGARLWF
ncbi:MAG: porin family protein [Pseudomonadota bacterium]